jgi:signal transduction histidine kinase
LTLARIAWAVCAGFVLTVFAAFIPIQIGGVYSDWQIQSGMLVVWPYVSFEVFAGYVLALRFLIAAVCIGVAALIVWRKPDDGVALMVSLGLIALPVALVSVDGTGRLYMLYGAPWHTLLQTVRDWLTTLSVHYLAFLFFIFPDGRFAPRWMKWAAWGVLVSVALIAGMGLGLATWEVWFTTFIVWTLLAVVSQVYRYLRVSGPAERQQTKWFVAAVAYGPVTMLVGLFGLVPGLTEPQANLLGMHMMYAWMLFLALSIGVGVLRRGLWGADPLLNRALVYAALTLLVLTLYGAIVFGLGAAFGSGGNVLLAVIATGVIAILFNPLRHRLQQAVNRLMYGERDDPAAALRRLGQRLETAVAPQATLATIAETVAQALKLPHAAIELREEGEQSWTVSHPPGIPPPLAVARFPLTYQSELMGHLAAAPRAAGEPFTAADRRLLEQIAAQAAPAVHAYRLAADLQRSRERIVVAREEERRRLRRDLHDGFGPALASQALKLDAAIDLVESEPMAAIRTLTEVKDRTQAIVADIRRMVYALRPPALDELGLVGALNAHLQSLPANAPRVTLEAGPLPRLLAAVEVAAYRIVLEAVTNTVRHAQASESRVRLAVTGGALEITVEDDGRGLPADHLAGVGLASVRERAAELGGTCTIENGPLGGARVSARLPLAPMAYG